MKYLGFTRIPKLTPERKKLLHLKQETNGDKLPGFSRGAQVRLRSSFPVPPTWRFPEKGVADHSLGRGCASAAEHVTSLPDALGLTPAVQMRMSEYMILTVSDCKQCLDWACLGSRRFFKASEPWVVAHSFNPSMRSSRQISLNSRPVRAN